MELAIAFVIVVLVPAVLVVLALRSRQARTGPWPERPYVTQGLAEAGAEDVIPAVEELIARFETGSGWRPTRSQLTVADVHVDPDRRAAGVLASMRWKRRGITHMELLVVGRLGRSFAARLMFTPWSPLWLRWARGLGVPGMEPVDEPRLGRAWSAFAADPVGGSVFDDERLWNALVAVTPSRLRPYFGEGVGVASAPPSPVPEGWWRMRLVTLELRDRDLFVMGSKLVGDDTREVLEDAAATFIERFGS